jgi:hypothetical protein
MIPWLILLLIIVFLLVGFAAKAFLWIAGVLLLLWIVGWALSGSDSRWYYW